MKNIGSVIAGLVVAFVTMMIFEFTNSFLFPFPEGMDISNLQAVRDFTDSMPNTAYILVLLGRFFGSLAGGYITTRISQEKQFRLSMVVAILLTLLGIANNVMLGAPMRMTVIGTIIFLISTYLGHRLAKK